MKKRTITSPKETSEKGEAIIRELNIEGIGNPHDTCIIALSAIKQQDLRKNTEETQNRAVQQQKTKTGENEGADAVQKNFLKRAKWKKQEPQEVKRRQTKDKATDEFPKNKRRLMIAGRSIGKIDKANKSKGKTTNTLDGEALMVNEILDKTLNYLNNLEQEIQKKTKTSKKSREGKKSNKEKETEQITTTPEKYMEDEEEAKIISSRKLKKLKDSNQGQVDETETEEQTEKNEKTTNRFWR